MTLVNCEVCKREFNVPPARIKSGRGKTCSPACNKIKRDRVSKKLESLKCDYCGKEFERHSCQIRKGKDRFCSKRCVSDSRRLVYPIGYLCNDYTVISDKSEMNGDKRAQLCRCKCGLEQLISTYRLFPGKFQARCCVACSKTDPYPKLNKEYLCKEHSEKGRSLRDIAFEIGCSTCLVSRRVKQFSVPRPKRHIKFDPSNLTGRKIGKWNVGKRVIITSKNGNKRPAYECRCDCGKISTVNACHLAGGASTRCGECRKNKLTGGNSPHWTGVGEMPGSYWNVIRQGAKSRKLQLKISKEQAWDLFLRQNKRCNLTGWEISFSAKTASLDRINSNIGYVEGNIQWLHKLVNVAKMDSEQCEFIKMCKAVATKCKGVKYGE